MFYKRGLVTYRSSNFLFEKEKTIMTIWLCDRCGTQVKKDSYGAGKYEISKPCKDENGTIYRRGLKFCDQCKMELEQFLDDEFSKMPTSATVTINGKM